MPLFKVIPIMSESKTFADSVCLREKGIYVASHVWKWKSELVWDNYRTVHFTEYNKKKYTIEIEPDKEEKKIKINIFEGDFNTVTNSSDEGIGSLRWVIDGLSEGETVSFDLPDGENTIKLKSPIYISKSITIDGILSNGNNVTLRPEKEYGHEIFNIDKYHTNVLINDVTFTKGGNSAIYSTVSGHMDLIHCNFYDNFSNKDGGAIYQRQSAGFSVWLTMEDCTFNNNRTYNKGGAVYVSGGHIRHINDCYFEGNECFGEDSRGGAFAYYGGADYSTLYINNTVINNNSANWGYYAFEKGNRDVKVIMDGGEMLTDITQSGPKYTTQNVELINVKEIPDNYI